jgi:hypothetical protein
MLLNAWGDSWAALWGRAWEFLEGTPGVDQPRSGGFLRGQAKRGRLLKEDEDILAFVTTVVTQGVLDGQSM